MTGATYTGTLVGSDGSKLVVRDAELVPTDTPTPTPTPGPAPVPGDANTVRVGGATYPLAAINPTRGPGRDYPGGRGTDQLVAYQQPTLFTETNQYGTEVTVLGGRVISVIDRLATGQTAGVIVPAGGYVLSGHGRARDWLNRWAVKSATVQVEHADTPEPAPGPVTGGSGGASAGGGRTIALYLKEGSAPTGQIPAGVNQVRYAFFQGSGLVDWGGEDLATQRANLAAWLRPGGRRLLISVGGQAGTVRTSDRAKFVQDFRRAEADLGGLSTGIDWDIEASALVPADVVAISQALAEGRKDNYLISFVPPGGPPVPLALQAAVELHRAGYLVQFGQQLFEGNTAIDQQAAIGALRRAVNAGLPPSCVLLGTMVGSDPKHWTIQMCGQVARAALTEWNDFGGAWLWSERYTEDDEWARLMAAVLA